MPEHKGKKERGRPMEKGRNLAAAPQGGSIRGLHKEASAFVRKGVAGSGVRTPPGGAIMHRWAFSSDWQDTPCTSLPSAWFSHTSAS